MGVAAALIVGSPARLPGVVAGLEAPAAAGLSPLACPAGQVGALAAAGSPAGQADLHPVASTAAGILSETEENQS